MSKLKCKAMTIDGKDIGTWGLTLSEGSLSEWLKLPKRKTADYNNWAESDGIEPDLSTVEWEETKIGLQFILQGSTMQEYAQNYRSLLSALSDKGVREISAYGLTRKLRMDQCTAYDRGNTYLEQGKGMGSIAVSLYEEEPEIYESIPDNGISLRGYYAINGYDLADFGIGGECEDEEILRYPGMKTPFTDGNEYDLSTMVTKHKDVKLSFWWMAETMDDFIRNRMALLWQLSRTGTLDLYIKSVGGTVAAYYTECTSFEASIYAGGRVGARMTLSFTIPVVSWVDAGGTSMYRVLLDNDLGLLADENGNVIVFN